MKTSLRRRAAAGLAGIVAASGLVLAAPSAQATTYGEFYSKSAGLWLTEQLQDGFAAPFGSADYGSTVDVLIALSEIDGFEDEIDEITAALAGSIETWVGDEDNVNAGATAKAAVGVLVAGGNPRDFGGVDLISRLESTISTEGRIDVPWPSTFNQVFAVWALSAAESPLAEPALDFLLDQQCDSGFIRGMFGDAGETCDEANDEPYVDSTALAVIAAAQTGINDAAFDEAVAWLASEQGSDGSFVGDEWSPAPNANSTGLAAWALGVSGEERAAADAGNWLLSVQIEVDHCDLERVQNVGAIAPTIEDYEFVENGEIDPLDYGMWHFATQQAAVGLKYSDAPVAVPGCWWGLERFEISLDRGTYAPGETVVISGSGVPFGVDVTVELHSDPVLLGTVVADELDEFTLSADIPSDTELGVHTIVATAVVAGETYTASAEVTIADIIPDTGAEATLTWFAAAFALVALGAMLVVTGRAQRWFA